MTQRRKVSSDVSAVLLEYVLKEAKVTQDELADALEVSPAFISRVRSRERSFTVDHLAAFEKLMKIPLGVILLAAVPPKSQTKTSTLQKLARQAILQADLAAKALATETHLSVR